MSSSQYERRKSRSEQETMQKPLKMSHKKKKKHAGEKYQIWATPPWKKKKSTVAVRVARRINTTNIYYIP